MIEQAVYTLLSSSAGIAALVDTRVYPLLLPEDSILPALTYQIVASTPSPTFDTSGMQRTRLQIDCWGKRYLDAVNVRAAVIEALDGYSDDTLLDVQLLNRIDFFDQDGLQYRALVEFYVLHHLS